MRELETYSKIAPIFVAVDCIIFGIKNGVLNLLIFKREVEPLAGKWSLLGSFVKMDEDVNASAQRILYELTGLKDVYMEQLHCFGNVGRDSGGRVISIAYWSLIKLDQDDIAISIDNHEAKWISIQDMPPLVLDHSSMVNMAIHQLRERCKFHPVGFELLPSRFTLPQLLKVYKAIFDREIDDRNFRKKILKSELLVDTGLKDMSTSKKGSFLYAFNKDRYKQLQKEGFDFQFR